MNFIPVLQKSIYILLISRPVVLVLHHTLLTFFCNIQEALSMALTGLNAQQHSVLGCLPQKNLNLKPQIRPPYFFFFEKVRRRSLR